MARYRDLLTMLKKPGCKQIEMPVEDMIPFIKYLDKARYKDKTFSRVENNKYIVSKQPQTITNN